MSENSTFFGALAVRSRVLPQHYAESEAKSIKNGITAEERPARRERVPWTTFMSYHLSTSELKQLRKVLGSGYCDALWVVDGILTELCHLIKQIRVLVVPPCHPNIAAIANRVNILFPNQLRLNRVLSDLEWKLERIHGDDDVFSFAQPFVSRLRTLHRPIMEMSDWSHRNVRNLVADDNGEGLVEPIGRIMTVLRRSGLKSLERGELHDLNVLDSCVLTNTVELDIHLDETPNFLHGVEDEIALAGGIELGHLYQLERSQKAKE